ncbi:MAG TPA: hypothetical protein VFV34_02145, partial [Blastocatellia bacterium]|nr:hypothetical protein [Blastocatellia bacterium]
EALKRAEAESDPSRRDERLEIAASVALEQRDPERAVAIARSISSEPRRSRTLESLLRSATDSALRSGDVDAAIRYAKGISNLDSRAFLLCKTADLLLKKKETDRARALLGDTWAWIQPAQTGPGKATTLLRVVGETVVIDPQMAFGMMESTVDEINQAGFAPAWVSSGRRIRQRPGDNLERRSATV